MPNAEYIQIPEAARQVGLSTRELFQRIDEGTVDAYRDKDGLVVVTPAAVAALRPE